MRFSWLLLVVLVLAAPARAQTTCSPNDFSTWLNSGPSMIVAATTPALDPGGNFFGMVRFGAFSGYFVRPEITVTRAGIGRDLSAVTAAFGLRVLPLGFNPGEGFKPGGGKGHSLGLLGGKGLGSTWYVGGAYEWKPCDYGGIVIELTKVLGGPLGSPASLGAGFQFDFPAHIF